MRRTFSAGALVVCLVVLPACAPSAAEIESPDKLESGTMYGVSLSPRSFNDEDFSAFITRSADTQDILLWAGDWDALREDGAAGVTTKVVNENGLVPLIEVGHHIQESGDLIRPLNDENKAHYLALTRAYIEAERPAYFGIGVEVDVFAQKNPEAFGPFVDFYNLVYDAIKEISPETKVFTVYQLEAMKGLPYWGVEEHRPQWELMGLFKADLAAFTTYPGLVYRDPDEIPANHYTEIRTHTDLPIVFTELGWHSAAHPPGWESSPEEQACFIQRFFELTEDLPVEIVIWSFMVDQDTVAPFASMGLITRENEEKPAWLVWSRLRE